MNSSNMDLWNKVSKTDPKHTRQVNFGKKFTAICAQYQRQLATEEFGPYGRGWGLVACQSTFSLLTDSLVLFQGTFFYVQGGERFEFPVESSIAHSPVSKGVAKLDEDCIKKLVTDAETKALSKLGFNADVFLGMFDDSKYVAKMRSEFSKNGKPAGKPAPAQTQQSTATLESRMQTAISKCQKLYQDGRIGSEEFKEFRAKISSVSSIAELNAISKEVKSLLEFKNIEKQAA